MVECCGRAKRRARFRKAGAARVPRADQNERIATCKSGSAVEVSSFSTAFSFRHIRYAIWARILVAPGLRILPELFRICRCKWLICFRISGA